jgi:hypothetical protein
MITEVQESPLATAKTDEIDFAYLTGFKPDIPPDAEPNDIDEDLDPEEHRTIRGLIGSPFSKIALVGGCGLFGFLLVGLFMNSVMSSSAKPITDKSTDKEANAIATATLDPKDVEIAKFKTDLALGSQLSGKSRTLRPSALPKPDPKLDPKSDLKVDLKDKSDANTAKFDDRTLDSPVMSNLSAPPMLSAPFPVRQIMSPIAPMAVMPRNLAAPVEAQNAGEEWQRLASIGSYGNLAAPTELPKAIATNPMISSNVSAQSIVIEKPRSNSLTSYLAQAEKSLQPVATPANTLLVGTTAKSTLKTAIVFSTDGSRTMGSTSGLIPKFIVTLQETISTADGKVAIPADAALIVTARPLDAKSGLSELDVVGIVINGRELTPPPNAIVIRGAEGKPLIADKYFDRGSEISGMDVATFLTSALAEVGKITNSPTSTSSISTIGGAATVNTSPPPNYLGAALSGGFGILSETLNRRSQQAIEEIKTRPNVFFIPAGKELQVFVNQTVTF